MQHSEQGQQTGTRNETYDVIAVLYHALQGAENCQLYVKDAQDEQVRDFLQQALQLQRQIADQGKQILQQALQKDTGGSSAFGWGQNQAKTFGEAQSSFAEQGTGQTTGGGSSF
jgi:UTP-glucose-1-phosphate uridylyltransferase